MTKSERWAVKVQTAIAERRAARRALAAAERRLLHCMGKLADAREEERRG